jgi:GTP diphosphokinase / guanosine-3',5'-bis(diphosphate) 3'-diphosphatase
LEALLAKIQATDTVEEAKRLLFDLVSDQSEPIQRALEIAARAHEGQYRKSGAPYFIHPVLVAVITASISEDEQMVAASLLHDVVEDTSVSIEQIGQWFGADIMHMVEGLTKIVAIRDEKLIPSTSNDRLINSALSFRKMLIASINDVRVLVIKLCDRLHNMLTLDALPPAKQKRIAEETLVVYAPIAHRLGISRLKNHLEDLSFFYIYPDDYSKIEHYLASNRQNLKIKLNAFVQSITQMLLSDGLPADSFEVLGRMKHHYSIYLKMHRKGISIEEVLDLLAIRIIVQEPITCYRVLGILHLRFTPLISRFKDYIAVPKENGYQTIHTTLFNEEGIVEAQIRTQQMHNLAEYGVAAHWKYKEGTDQVNLEWLEGLNFQNESVEEFYELAKFDLFSEDIAVFSPKGDYFTLPKNSTALDFAYAVHTEIGATATEALINKHRSSLIATLKNGDIVRIITGDEERLHCSWIHSVKTSRAKEAIRSSCRQRIKISDEWSAYNILSTLLDHDAQEIRRAIHEMALEPNLYRLTTQLDFFKDVINRIATSLGTKEVRFWELMKRGYKTPFIKEVDHFVFYANKPFDGVEFDYCCHPKVGDQIVAFYKDNKAIIHHKLCRKAYQKIQAHQPMIFVAWKSGKLSRYRLIVSLVNQKGALAGLLAKLTKMDLNVTSIELGIKSSESAEYCQIEVESSESKKSILKERLLHKIKLVDMISLDDAYSA